MTAGGPGLRAVDSRQRHPPGGRAAPHGPRPFHAEPDDTGRGPAVPHAAARSGLREPTSVHLVLTGPGGGTWDIPIGQSSPAASVGIVTDAVGFCWLVANRAAPDRLDLHITGDPDRAAMVLAAASSLALDLGGPSARRKGSWDSCIVGAVGADVVLVAGDAAGHLAPVFLASTTAAQEPGVRW